MTTLLLRTLLVALAIRAYKVADFMGSPAGQVVGLIKELKPARQILFDIIDEARDILDGWASVPV